MEKKRKFQDGGIDLPVHWKTIETAHWDRVSLFLLKKSFSALRPDTHRLRFGQMRYIRSGTSGNLNLKDDAFLNISG